MTADRMLETLKDYGINSREDFEKEYRAYKGVDISLFVAEGRTDVKKSNPA
jgi:hypothetical protein